MLEIGCIFRECIPDTKGIWVFPAPYAVDAINSAASLHDPILTVLDLPTDSESCFCNLLY